MGNYRPMSSVYTLLVCLGNYGHLGSVFIDLIDSAFRAHRQWHQNQDDAAYHDWAEGLKLEAKAALEQWLPKAGYATGLLLCSLRDKAHQNSIDAFSHPSTEHLNPYDLTFNIGSRWNIDEVLG